MLQAACAVLLAWRGSGRSLAGRLSPLACCLLLPAITLLPRPGMAAAILASHTALYGGLALLFGSSLLPGREPLVTGMARGMEPVLTREMRSYTRRVTWLWALYGPAQIACSLLLLRFASLHAWSVFVNLLDFPLLAAFFLGEYAYRRWSLRGSTRATLADTLRAALQQARRT